MIVTAVQEHAQGQVPHLEYHSRIICGSPLRRKHGERGPIHLFEPETLVAYELTVGTRGFGFVFRTLAQPDRFACALAGVRPGVRLLISAVGTGQLARLNDFLRVVDRPAGSLQQVTDEFLLRAGSCIFSRRSIAQVVAALRNTP